MRKEYVYKVYGLSPAYVKKSCEDSLKCLDMEYVALYQPHRIDYLTHPQALAGAFEDLKREGKIRHAGLSNHTSDELRAFSA